MYSVFVETKQRPWTRFSEQAKREADWLSRLHDRFDKDFSFPRLVEYYAAEYARGVRIGH